MIFFLTLTVTGPLNRKDFKRNKYEGKELISEKTKALYTEVNERTEAGTSSYYATENFLQNIHSVHVTKNYQKIRSRCLVHELSFTYINHGYRAAILKKNSLWLLLFYMAAATYCYHQKVRRTMCTAIVSYRLHILTKLLTN